MYLRVYSGYVKVTLFHFKKKTKKKRGGAYLKKKDTTHKRLTAGLPDETPQDSFHQRQLLLRLLR